MMKSYHFVGVDTKGNGFHTSVLAGLYEEANEWFKSYLNDENLTLICSFSVDSHGRCENHYLKEEPT